MHDGDAEVDVRGKRVRVRIARPARWSPAPERAAGRAGERERAACSRATDVPADLQLIGCTVDEALTRAEKFLDETLLTEQRTVRVIHGLRHGPAPARDCASSCTIIPWSPRFESAAPEQGGGGVTVVELKD